MSIPRSQYLFFGLMSIGFLTAFVPAKLNMPGAGQLQGLFSPVSRPVRALAGLLDRRMHDEPVVDDRSPATPRATEDVYQENHALLTQLASLQVKFDQLSQLNADRQAVGDIRSLCKPATVTGTDSSGFREAITLTLGSISGSLVNCPVIRGNPSQARLPCDLVGRIVNAGVLGTKARLVTDPGFGLVARIGRYVPQPDGRLKITFANLPPSVVQGIGHNAMAIRGGLSMQQVRDANVSVNDVVVLDDAEWPANIQGFSVGRIVSIAPQQNAPLFADIRIEPATRLMRLTDVMVMVR